MAAISLWWKLLQEEGDILIPEEYGSSHLLKYLLRLHVLLNMLFRGLLSMTASNCRIFSALIDDIAGQGLISSTSSVVRVPCELKLFSLFISLVK